MWLGWSRASLECKSHVWIITTLIGLVLGKGREKVQELRFILDHIWSLRAVWDAPETPVSKINL